jgi:hypothetical protein
MKMDVMIPALIVLLSGPLTAAAGAFQSSKSESAGKELKITMPGSPFGIAAGFLYGYQGVKPYEFMPQVRKLGSGLTKVYLFWNQVEPEKGKYDWTAVDKFVDQLNTPEEGLLAFFSSSQWAVRKPSSLLPPSPAKNPDDYYRFVYDVVKHCRGKIRYWQNDSEPNNPIYWSGTKEEFVAQLKVFYKAVKDADPTAVVVVGGYDGLFGPPGTYQMPNQQIGLSYFDYVLDEGRNAFDVFDLRLYGDPYTIAPRVEFMRQKMMALGYTKPIIATEYGGPGLFEFAENRKYIPLVISWSQSMAKGDEQAPAGKNQIEELYEKMATLAPVTQMFMQGCPPELDARYQRIQARGVVMRNVFALSAGVQKTIYWYLPGFPVNGKERYNVMSLMYGKIGMIDVRDDKFEKRTVTADAFERMAKALTGVQAVKRILLPDKPSVFLFEVDRGKLGQVLVVWDRRDAFTGEDAPSIEVGLPWGAKKAIARDALGLVVPVQVESNRVRLPVSLTPIFITGS